LTRTIYLPLTLALTAFAAAPLAYPGYIQVHSGFVPLYNLADLAVTSFALTWAPHIATTFEPLRGDGLLAYYLALPLVLLGAAPMTAVKVVLFVSFFLGATGMYLWLRRSLGRPGACLAALIYTYAPYRIAVTYVRGAWGEALALGLLPFGMASALRTPRQGTQALWLILATGTWLAVGLSQPGLAALAWLCLVLWCLSGGRGRYSPWPVGAAGVGVTVSVTLTAWLAGWRLGAAPVVFADHYLVPAQLLSPFWGFGASRPGWNDGLSLSLGVAPVGLALLTLLVLLQRRGGLSNAVNLRSPAVVAVAMGALLFAPADVVWRMGLSSFVSYPWQVLGLAVLCLAVIGGAATTLVRRLSTPPRHAALIAITLLASYSYLQPRFTQFEPGVTPYASLNRFQVLVLDVHTEVEIPPTAAGLPQPTPGRLAVADYGQPRPGDTVRLLITWQALQPLAHDYKLFVHLLSPDGAVIAQVDPIAGAAADPDDPGADYPASRWDPGRLVVTDVPITLSATAPPGAYRIAFGLYDGQTLERLPVDGVEGGALVVDMAGGARAGR
jgi:hypothetical protein